MGSEAPRTLLTAASHRFRVHSQGRALARKSDFRNVFLTKLRTNPATHRLSPASTPLAQESQQAKAAPGFARPPFLADFFLLYYF